MESLHGKVALVTGASSGIGEAIARLLVVFGVHVIGFARRAKRLEAITRSLEGHKGTFDPFPGDVRNEEDILDVFAYSEYRYTGIDILVNDAGVAYANSITNTSTDHFRQILETNTLAVAITSREAVKAMRRHGRPGHIVNIVSDSALGSSYLPLSLYPSSKYATRAITENIRQEITQNGDRIKITGIYPGLVRTEIAAKSGGNPDIVYRDPHLEPLDIADAVLFALQAQKNIQISRMTVTPLHERT